MAGKILVVDDDPNLRKIICRLLSSEGFATEQAENAEKAREILESSDIGLMVLDIMMPGMDGYDFCESIQDNPEFAKIPVLMLTARKDMVDKFRGYMAGAVDYMTKPFRNTELLDKVRSLYTY